MKEAKVYGIKVYIDDAIKECFRSNGSVNSILANDDEKDSLLCKVQQDMADKKYTDSDSYTLWLAIEESYQNAKKHAKTDRVEVNYNVTDKYVQFTVKSNPTADFDPTKLKDPRIEENLTKSNGRGILLIVTSMNAVCFSEDYSCMRCIRYKGGNDLEVNQLPVPKQ